MNQDILLEKKAAIVVEILDISREIAQSSAVVMVVPLEGETLQDPAQFRETDPEEMIEEKREGTRVDMREDNPDPVSYTHLTLPTNREV